MVGENKCGNCDCVGNNFFFLSILNLWFNVVLDLSIWRYVLIIEENFDWFVIFLLGICVKEGGCNGGCGVDCGCVN